jgi:hypothetical protein
MTFWNQWWIVILRMCQCQVVEDVEKCERLSLILNMLIR